MCEAFEKMIDKAENEYGVIVVCFCCDNDGGSQNGRKRLIEKRPWLFGPPCCGHQVRFKFSLTDGFKSYQSQLILGDYFKENPEAAETAADATETIGWINNHTRVRVIFDEAQEDANPGKEPLKYLVANMTRWSTHFLSFDRLLFLKDPMRRAVILRRMDIVAAQLGAEKNARKREAMTTEANLHCDRIDGADGSGFWKKLQDVVDDIEPICYSTNINQSDKTRPDQVLLTFAGIFLHFQRHENRGLSRRMLKRIEKRWKALDQDLLVAALILNPYERLERFGDKANINQFTLNTMIVAVCHSQCRLLILISFSCISV